MINTLRKIAIYFEKKRNSLFRYDINKQKTILYSYEEPKDLVERSYLQYKCQMKLYGFVASLLLNIISYLLLIILLVKYKINKNKKTSCTSKIDAVFFRDGKPNNILPNSIKKKYKYIEDNPEERNYITNDDAKYIIKILSKYPLSPFLSLKTLIKIAKYRSVIDLYHPKAIIVCAEYSFTSSLLTNYCRKNRINHINVMHGEKLFYMRDSFFEFDKCYVWDKYYENLFVKLRAAKKQFIIEVPNSLIIKKAKNSKKRYDYTYYLASEPKKVLKNIAQSLMILKEEGKKISVRPHPRYSNKSQIKKMFNFADIENTSEVPIEESLLQTKKAISLYSTVLNQAFFNSIDIIIDDVNNKNYYNKLRELEYICLKYKHELLSNIMERTR